MTFDKYEMHVGFIVVGCRFISFCLIRDKNMFGKTVIFFEYSLGAMNEKVMHVVKDVNVYTVYRV